MIDTNSVQNIAKEEIDRIKKDKQRYNGHGSYIFTLLIMIVSLCREIDGLRNKLTDTEDEKNCINCKEWAERKCETGQCSKLTDYLLGIEMIPLHVANDFGCRLWEKREPS